MDKKRTGILTFESLEIGYINGKTKKILLPAFKGSAEEGELIAVVGKNGIGKSTLLRTIAGLQPVITGSLQIGGKSIHEYSRLQLSAKVGYVSTEIIKVSNMKVYDLVSLGRFPHTDWFGRIDPLNHEAVMDALSKTGMTGFIDRPVTELSDGERQRAMIAMVLAQDAVVMVMDEPTAFLDINSKYMVIRLLRELTQQGNKTIIYSTHDFNTAISQADRIWLMLDDTFIEGAPEDVMISGAFKKLFDETKVTFNTDDGSFSIKSKPKGEVCIKGEGGTRYWTERALIRAGYSIAQSESEIIVQLPSEHEPLWKCIFNNSDFRFESIYDLIKWIRKSASIS